MDQNQGCEGREGRTRMIREWLWRARKQIGAEKPDEDEEERKRKKTGDSRGPWRELLLPDRKSVV